MPLTGNWTLAILSALALLAAVTAVLFWDRIRSWPRWPARLAMIVTCQLTACLVVAALVNDMGQFYTSWSELGGSGSGVTISHLRAGAEDRKLTELLRRQGRLGKSLVVPVYVPEAGAAKADDALVYLPAAYFNPSYADTTFPVIELLGGFPSSPRSWIDSLRLQQIADREIGSRRSVPFVAVIPVQNYLPRLHDGECINAVGGPQVETTLTVNVRRVIEHDFRVDRGRAGWSVMGYSTGGFCALNIAMRHPSWYGSAVSLSGYDQPYIDRTTGALFGTSSSAEHLNDPLWRARHLRAPSISILLTASRPDVRTWRDAYQLAAAARAPTRAFLLMLPRGGHNFATIRDVVPAAIDWLGQLLSLPLAPPARAGGLAPEPYHRTPAKHERRKFVQAAPHR